jgi:hypothetical protein
LPRVIIILLFVVSGCAFLSYMLIVNDNSGLVAKGGNPDDTLMSQYVALATAVVSMITAVLGLAKTVVERRRGD